MTSKIKKQVDNIGPKNTQEGSLHSFPNYVQKI
jgi:hypothetical protein